KCATFHVRKWCPRQLQASRRKTKREPRIARIPRISSLVYPRYPRNPRSISAERKPGMACCRRSVPGARQASLVGERRQHGLKTRVTGEGLKPTTQTGSNLAADDCSAR